MRSVRVVVVLILLPFTLVWGALVTGAAPAQAQTEDVVRNLDVHYDVRADGTVRATYDLDWDFGSTGRHGINFGIVTRETWDQDPSLEAVYLIEDIDVSSPDDVPVDVHRTDAARETTLRIGDPDVTLDV